MKSLGIPNTKQFFEVTTIADALALWKTLQEREKGAGRGQARESEQRAPEAHVPPPPRSCVCVTAGGFKVEEDEEFEDDEGNVYNRKTYMDLKRQGLL